LTSFLIDFAPVVS